METADITSCDLGRYCFLFRGVEDAFDKRVRLGESPAMGRLIGELRPFSTETEVYDSDKPVVVAIGSDSDADGFAVSSFRGRRFGKALDIMAFVSTFGLLSYRLTLRGRKGSDKIEVRL